MASVTVSAASTTMSQFEGNARHLAFTPDKIGNFDTFISQHIIAPPSVDGGTLLVTTGKAGRRQEGQVLRVDARTGAIVWRTSLSNMTMTQAIVADRDVIVGLGGKRMFTVNAGYSCRSPFLHAIVALQAATGKPVWEYATHCQDMPTPDYTHHEVLTPTGGERFIALDARTGKLLWQIRIGGWSAMSSPARVGSNLYFGTDNSFTDRNDFYDIDWRTHKVRWLRNFAHAVNLAEASPVVRGNAVFTAFMRKDSYDLWDILVHLWKHTPMRDFAFEVVSLDAATGRLIHRKNIYTRHLSPRAWIHERILSSEIYWKNWVVAALRKMSHAIHLPALFSSMRRHDPTHPGIYDPPLTAWHRIIYVEPRLTKRLYALDAHTERILWTFRTGADVSNPNIYHGALYTVNARGMLYVLNARTGKLIHTEKLATGTVGPSDGLLSPYAFVVGGTSGNLVSLPIRHLNGSAGAPGKFLHLGTKAHSLLMKKTQADPAFVQCVETLIKAHDG
ncbi:PQQ-binding-like beta-propeller repeat protein [Acidithiobacillus ferrooxidans]|uniref:outer membrane protein assembly factor BamB family protein n=1 Tax=Acidithiobacillus ferrooxidans TaxID=920 RepID=UPI001D0146B0|nr:PQQ-binding-like beta-propeller repeat protein [Acidithiobacillus ferrooxidans]MCR2830138.1 PQQ-binding-like beta-propeller repeat protein [Acidithiobacillus ferrooxidans]